MNSLREQLGIEEPYEELCTAIVQDSTDHNEAVRSGAALALAQVLQVHDSYIPATLQTLMDLYQDKLYVRTSHPNTNTNLYTNTHAYHTRAHTYTHTFSIRKLNNFCIFYVLYITISYCHLIITHLK